MDAHTKQNIRLRRELLDLYVEISGEIDHGECFYEKEMLNDFCNKLDKLKNLAREYYVSNQED